MEISNWKTNEVIIERDVKTIKELVEIAVKENISLQNANLINANLQYADLTNADLTNADLQDTDLINANLINANLEYANLRNADLINAILINANLRNADLINADLRNVYLEDGHYWLIQCKQQLLYLLQNSPIEEVNNLKELLKSGKIDGTRSKGNCCCLIGTLSHSKDEDRTATFINSHIPYYIKGLHNPCEQLFYQIREGDTLENNFFSRHAKEVIDLILKK